MAVMRTDDEVGEQVDAANEIAGTRWPGMTYEEGVDAALRWVMGWTDDKPMTDDE